jgi:hypothetical protein
MRARWTGWTTGVALGILVASGCAMSRSARGGENTDNIVVAVFNYAGLPPETLMLAEAQASKIYEKAGIQMDWRELSIPAEGRMLPTVDRPAVRPVAYMKLVADAAIMAEHPSLDTFGFALGNQVYVFADRVLEAYGRDTSQCPLHTIFGHIMAHEIGHVLLGQNSHALKGIMTPRLGAWEFWQMQMGALSFVPEQAEKMRKRIRAQQPDQMNKG